MQQYIVSPGEVLPVLLEDVELCGPVDMPRIWLEPGSNPPNLPKVAPKVANLRHVVMRNMHDVSAIWSHPTETPLDIQAGLEWYDVYSDLHGWHCPDDPTRPGGLHGHSGYFQDDERFGTRVIRKCVFGRSFATPGKVYAESNNVLDGVKYSKTANYLFEDCIFFDDPFLIGNWGATNRDAINITTRRCVFIGGLTVGYNGSPCADNTVEDCAIFGTLSVKAGANITVRNNTIITEGPYRTPGYLYDNGSGAVSVVFSAAASHVNPVFENNLLYTDGPLSAFNGRTRAQSLAGGGMVTGTEVVGGVDDFPAFTRRIDIPERQAAWMVVYNPTGAPTMPLGDYKRVRDVRRWHSPYISNELTMSGEPDAPINWDTTYGPPPIAPNLFPEFGIFRLEQPNDGEITMNPVEQFNTALAALNVAGGALVVENTALAAQVATLTVERDALAAKVAAFTVLIDQLYTLAHPTTP